MESDSRKNKPASRQRLQNSINIPVTGNNNTIRVDYKAPSTRQPTIEELLALQAVLKAQQRLIKVYQKKK